MWARFSLGMAKGRALSHATVCGVIGFPTAARGDLAYAPAPMPTAAPKAWDVPPVIALGLLALAGAILFPIAHRTALYPTSLPPLAVDAAEVLAEHRRDLQRPRPPATAEALAAWSALTLAHARRDGRAKVPAQAQFAQTLFDATDGAPERAHAVRAVAAQRWLDALGDPGDPGTMIAARHALAGPHADPTMTDAHRLGWFLLRWERLALPTPERGEVEPVTDTLLRVSAPVQRGFAAWVIASRCTAIIGLDDQHDPRACAGLRRPMIAMAARLDPTYPRAEAMAATDVMLAVALRHPSPAVLRARAAAGAGGGSDIEEAQAALHNAQDRYAALAHARPDRRWERHSLAVLRELSE